MSCCDGPTSCVPAVFCTPPNFSILFPQLIGATGPTGPSSGPMGATGATGPGYTLPSTPVVNVGSGAGTGATCTISGSDNGFSITLTTGTSPNTSGNLFVVTLGAGNPSNPAVAGPCPTNQASASSAAISPLFTVTTQTTVTVPSPSTVALVANTAYTWDFVTTSI